MGPDPARQGELGVARVELRDLRSRTDHPVLIVQGDWRKPHVLLEGSRAGTVSTTTKVEHAVAVFVSALAGVSTQFSKTVVLLHVMGRNSGH